MFTFSGHPADIVIPQAMLYEATSYFQSVAASEGHVKSTGSINRAVATLFPDKVIARKAASQFMEQDNRGRDPGSNVAVSGIDSEGGFSWNTGDNIEGSGKIVMLRSKMQFVSERDFPGENVVAATPSVWVEKKSGKKVSSRICSNNIGGVSLEHTCPSAWLVNQDGLWFGIAAGYACMCAYGYSDMITSNRPLKPLERNILTTVTPFSYGGEVTLRAGVRYLAGLPEKSFSQWKLKYNVPFQRETLVFNQETGTFKVVGFSEREREISSLKSNEVWLTPGEMFKLDGINRYSGKIRFSDPFDMTVNGVLMEQESDLLRPISLITTSQGIRLSLSQTELLLNNLLRQMGLSTDKYVFVNWDKHGAGGIFVAA